LFFRRNSLTLCFSKEDDIEDRIYVFFPDEDKLGVAPIKR
jgi:hypothetical protein